MRAELRGANPATFATNEEKVKCDICEELILAEDGVIIHNMHGRAVKGDNHAIICENCNLPYGWRACGCGG